MGNYSLAIRMYPEVCLEFDFGSLTTTYSLLGVLQNPSLQTIIQNWTDVPIWISWDGINNHFPLASGCAWDSDNATNKSRESGLYIAQGQPFYVMQLGDTVATQGSIYLTTFYGQGA
ncbi:MAG TPA: hypothetical protein VHA52_02255 [Candidatus Babeliaceae bacterium]|nr:hypothetical protein [Candidatus Babeliaceae bacterium]